MNKTILIVEDEMPLQKAIQKKMEDAGYDTLTAREADQGLKYLEEIGKIDVIWLDHYLLGKDDGLCLLEKIKAHKDWKKIPVFVVTNTASSDKIKQYISFGVEKYYIKSEIKLDDIIKDIKGFEE